MSVVIHQSLFSWFYEGVSLLFLHCTPSFLKPVPLRIIDFPFSTCFSNTFIQGCLKFSMTMTITNTLFQ